MSDDKNPDPKLAYTKRPLSSDIPWIKGTLPKAMEAAKGGPEITGRSIFMKTADTVRTDNQRQDYGGKDPLAKAEGDTKSETPIKPRT